MNVVTTKNGATEAEPLVAAMMLTLRDLFATKPIHAFELVELCRNPAHQPFGETGTDLADLGLISARGVDWHVHDSIRNIVLSAVQGEGLDMTLGYPAQEPGS